MVGCLLLACLDAGQCRGDRQRRDAGDGRGADRVGSRVRAAGAPRGPDDEESARDQARLVGRHENRRGCARGEGMRPRPRAGEPEQDRDERGQRNRDDVLADCEEPRRPCAETGDHCDGCEHTDLPRVTRERRGTRPRRGRGTDPARRSRTARACRSPRREPPAAPVPAARRSRTSAARARRRARRPGSGRGSTHRHPRQRSKRAPWPSRCRRGRRTRDRPPRVVPACSPPAKYREPPRRGPPRGVFVEATMTCSRMPGVSNRAIPANNQSDAPGRAG